MTPLAMKVLRAALNARQTSVATTVAKATCFDVTPVSKLLQLTAADLRERTTEHASDAPLMEHGGLLFMPAEIAWIEQVGTDGRRVGALVEQVDEQIGYVSFGYDLVPFIAGFMELKDDGEHFSCHLDTRWASGGLMAHNTSAVAAGWVSSALLLINAPRGVERATSSPHKGLVREVRRSLGIGALQPSHTIKLSTAAGDVGEGGTGHGSPKMFHFCRSHVRRLAGGRTTRVRAHWRGDPSLGIADGNYRVDG